MANPVKLKWLKKAADRPAGHEETRNYSSDKWMIDQWVKLGLCKIVEGGPKAKKKAEPDVDKAIKEAPKTRRYKRRTTE